MLCLAETKQLLLLLVFGVFSVSFSNCLLNALVKSTFISYFFIRLSKWARASAEPLVWVMSRSAA